MTKSGPYIHIWNTPIVLKILGVDEHRYYGPMYDPKKVPVIYNILPLWYDNHDGFWNDGPQARAW
jgi:hypothetical protein